MNPSRRLTKGAIYQIRATCTAWKKIEPTWC